MTGLEPAAAPTLYFFGVTTTKSSIMKVFPAWAKQPRSRGRRHQGRRFSASRAGRNPIGRRLAFLKNDPQSLGALVTTHKIDLYQACRDLFDEVDPHALLHGRDELPFEAGRQARLPRQGSDLLRSRARRLPARAPFRTHGRGGVLDGRRRLDHRADVAFDADARAAPTGRRASSSPNRERGAARGDPAHPCGARLRRSGSSMSSPRTRATTTRRLRRFAPGSLVVNATGLGKDAPGSPLTDAARFPERAIAWDLNYRGDLVFLDQARAQAKRRALQVEDGWTYFLHGWTQVIAEVFHIRIPVRGPEFEALSEIAQTARQG